MNYSFSCLVYCLLFYYNATANCSKVRFPFIIRIIVCIDDRDVVTARQEVTSVTGSKVDVNDWIAAIYNDKWYPGAIKDWLIHICFNYINSKVILYSTNNTSNQT